jgi:hypothetical protein
MQVVTGVVATDGNRVAVEVSIEHGSHMDTVARACEDYFYNLDPQVDVLRD